MRLPRVILVLGAALVVSGCGASDPDQVKAKVQQFAKAVGERDYGTICEQVLAPALVRHLTANDISCEKAMQVALQGVRQPYLSIGKVTIKGGSAAVIALSTAQDQPAALEAIELVKTGGGWRISALGSPLQTAPGSH